MIRHITKRNADPVKDDRLAHAARVLAADLSPETPVPQPDVKRREVRRARSALNAWTSSPHTGEDETGLRAEHHLHLAEGALRIARTAVAVGEDVDREHVAEHLAPDRRLSLEVLAADAGQYAASACASFAADVALIVPRAADTLAPVHRRAERLAQALREHCDTLTHTRRGIEECARMVWALARYAQAAVNVERQHHERRTATHA